MKYKNENKVELNTSFEELKNIDKYAEGSEELKETLLCLWNHNIKTIGCCKGHDNKKQYIGIKIEKESVDKIINLLSSLSRKDLHISFVSQDDKNNCAIKKYNDDIYNNIKQAINKKETDNDIKDIINKIKDRNKSTYINTHIYYKNNKVEKKYIVTNDIDLINKYKEKYEYKMLNKNANLYYFTII